MESKGRPSDWRICPCGNHLWHRKGPGLATRKLINGSIVRVKIEYCTWHKRREVGEGLKKNLRREVDELGYSVRVANCLWRNNIRYVGELVQKTESQLLATKNFGRKSLKEIKGILAEMGLSLGMKIDWSSNEKGKDNG